MEFFGFGVHMVVDSSLLRFGFGDPGFSTKLGRWGYPLFFPGFTLLSFGKIGVVLLVGAGFWRVGDTAVPF